MTESLLEIVDGSDSPIGTATKAEVLSKGLTHRVVRIMLEDDAGQVLLRRSSAEMELWSDLWTSSAAGYVATGEDYAAAAQRNAATQLGITNPSVLQELGGFYYCGEFEGKRLRRFNRVFSAVVGLGEAALNLQEPEASQVVWLPRSVVKSLAIDSPQLVTPSLSQIAGRFY